MNAVDLPLIWALIIAFAILAYVILDGFDLGVGILFPHIPAGEQRDIAMNSIAPVWDGNETWLVLGGGGLLAAFPLAYAVSMTAFYPLVIAMLLGLVMRGVAFEFRWRTVRARPVWDWGFSAGSLVAGLAQGMMVGALVQGVKVENRVYAGGWFDWLSPFSVLTAVALVIGYALLGATWLIWRTQGDIQARARRIAQVLAPALLVALVAVCAVTPLIDAQFRERWFSWPTMLVTLPVPLLSAAAGLWLLRSIRQQRELMPFLSTLSLFALFFAGFGINIYPDIVPPHISIRAAASPDASLSFLLMGAAFLIPIILAYTAWSYYVFRGKVGHEEGYH